MFALLLAGFALFLCGVNAGIIYRFFPEPWLSAKMVAVSSLLVYVTISLLFYHPDPWRVMIAAAAVCFDAGAVIGIYQALRRADLGDGVLVAYRRR